MFPQGTTQYDALGHAWYGDKLYNGLRSKTTMAACKSARFSRSPNTEYSARRTNRCGRYKGKKHLDRDEGFTLDDLLGHRREGVTIEKHDIIVLHTDGSIASTRRAEGALPEGQVFDEPGLQYSKELVAVVYEWRFRRSRRTRSDASRPQQGNRRFGHPPFALLCNLGVISMRLYGSRFGSRCAKGWANTVSFSRALR